MREIPYSLISDDHALEEFAEALKVIADSYVGDKYSPTKPREIHLKFVLAQLLQVPGTFEVQVSATTKLPRPETRKTVATLEKGQFVTSAYKQTHTDSLMSPSVLGLVDDMKQAAANEGSRISVSLAHSTMEE